MYISSFEGFRDEDGKDRKLKQDFKLRPMSKIVYYLNLPPRNKNGWQPTPPNAPWNFNEERSRMTHNAAVDDWANSWEDDQEPDVNPTTPVDPATTPTTQHPLPPADSDGNLMFQDRSYKRGLAATLPAWPSRWNRTLQCHPLK